MAKGFVMGWNLWLNDVGASRRQESGVSWQAVTWINSRGAQLHDAK